MKNAEYFSIITVSLLGKFLKTAKLICASRKVLNSFIQNKLY